MNATESSTLGCVLGKYKLLALLGQGGMADVYLAVVRGPSGFNKLLVLKLLRAGLARDTEFRTMFLEEARIAARLNHENIVQTYDVGHEAGHCLIVMEYLEGQPFSRILQQAKRQNELPVPLHLRVVADALNGLHAAHELADYHGAPMNLVHRDVNPHNVFVTYSGQVKVLDFGIAKAANSSPQTLTGVLKGRISYMAPEHMLGEVLDRRADIYSTGVMLWEAATGERLWKGQDNIAVMQKVVSGQIPTPQSINPNVDERLQRVCIKAMAVKKEDRYLTCLELRDDLEALLLEHGSRSASRELGRFVSELFTTERAEVKQAIDRQLGKLKGLASGEFSAPAPIVLDTRALSVSGMDAPASEVLRAPTVEQLTATGGRTSPSAVVPQPMSLVPRTPTQTRRRTIVKWAGLATLAAGAVFGLARGSARTGTASATLPLPFPSPSGTTGDRPTEASAVEIADVDLHVSAFPVSARLFLDSEALPANPCVKRLRQSAQPHTLKAEAPGFSSKSLLVIVDRDMRVELSLDREEKPAPVSVPTLVRSVPQKAPAGRPASPPRSPPTPAPAPSSPPAPAAEPSKPPPGKITRPLDTANPWER